VLFLDEPTLGLDPQSRGVIWDYIGKMASKEGTTIVLTTHYMEEAEMMCNRIAIIDQGKIVKEGSPESLRHGLGGDLVRVKAPSLDQSRLSQLPFVRHVQIEGDVATITVEKASHNLPELLRALDHIDDVEVHSPTLNDVFLAYTGHHIRDEVESSTWMDDAMRVRNQGSTR
jgi:ABC-2 type transport system ATP-binding protein